MYSRLALSQRPSPVTVTAANGLLLHEAARDLPDLPMGPFALTPDGAIVAVDESSSLTSRDQGRTWEAAPLFAPGQDLSVRPERAILCTREGVLISSWLNDREMQWDWSDETLEAPGAQLPNYTLRSLDGGRTWGDLCKVHDSWTGAVRNMIQTASGRVVFTSMQWRHHPGRNTVMTYASDDLGLTWQPSNILDLGDRGNHGGVTESTIVELTDGRLLMLLRTNWSQFWLAESLDQGLYWHSLGPAGIDASSAPGLLLRLASGRIALMWNRLYPEGATSYPLSGGDGIWSSVPVSNYRGELSIAFSEDECRSFTAPVVLARDPRDQWVAYPYALEVEPGLLWITTMQGDLRMCIREADLLA